MKSSYRLFNTGFGDQLFEINCNSEEAFSIAEFLFCDLPGEELAGPARRYDVVATGPLPTFSLWEGDKRLYFGESRYQLAYTLMNEVIFHCITNNDSHHALHAGAVWKDDRCIILPGKSGKGKSSLTSWLVNKGCQYLTDELVLLDSAAEVLAMTRPISLKVTPKHESWLLPEDYRKEIISGAEGSMIPHRLFNPAFTAQKPRLTDIIFPEYNRDGSPGLQQLSPARSSLYLLQSHVNARNLGGHGVSEIASITRMCRSFTLTYRCFADLEELFAKTDFGLV